MLHVHILGQCRELHIFQMNADNAQYYYNHHRFDIQLGRTLQWGFLETLEDRSTMQYGDFLCKELWNHKIQGHRDLDTHFSGMPYQTGSRCVSGIHLKKQGYH